MFTARVPALLKADTVPNPVNADTPASPPEDNAPRVAEVRFVAADARKLLKALSP